ncbi:MAG: peptidoglycan endopeptidase [Pseudomonadota bacterium]
MPIRIERPRTCNQAGIAACAAKLLDAPFRLHGRSVETGLDCVGVVARCLCDIGDDFEAPIDYGARGQFEERALAFFEARTFQNVADYSFVAGDIFLLRPGPRQIHFAVLAQAGAVHAHMGLRRVVLTPLPLPYRKIAQWRIQGD